MVRHHQDCFDAIWTELKQAWHEPALIPACQTLDIPVLIIDGTDDLRPRWAVDSLEHALPHVIRRILASVPHSGQRGPHSPARSPRSVRDLPRDYLNRINVDSYYPQAGGR